MWRAPRVLIINFLIDLFNHHNKKYSTRNACCLPAARRLCTSLTDERWKKINIHILTQ